MQYVYKPISFVASNEQDVQLCIYPYLQNEQVFMVEAKEGDHVYEAQVRFDSLRVAQTLDQLRTLVTQYETKLLRVTADVIRLCWDIDLLRVTETVELHLREQTLEEQIACLKKEVNELKKRLGEPVQTRTFTLTNLSDQKELTIKCCPEDEQRIVQVVLKHLYDAIKNNPQLLERYHLIKTMTSLADVWQTELAWTHQRPNGASRIIYILHECGFQMTNGTGWSDGHFGHFEYTIPEEKPIVINSVSQLGPYVGTHRICPMNVAGTTWFYVFTK